VSDNCLSSGVDETKAKASLALSHPSCLCLTKAPSTHPANTPARPTHSHTDYHWYQSRHWLSWSPSFCVRLRPFGVAEGGTARRLQPATRTTRPRQYLLSNLFTYGIPQPPPPLHNTASVRASQRMADPRSPFPGLPGRVVALLLAAITGLLLGGDHVQAAFVKPLGAGAAAVSKWLALFWGRFLLSLPLSISFDFPLSCSDPPPPPALSSFPISLTHSRAAASACRLRPKPSRARV